MYPSAQRTPSDLSPNCIQGRLPIIALQSPDRAVGISGSAGTGKTATLQELGGLMDAGHKVLAVAPTMSAVEEAGFADAITAERLLRDLPVRDGVRGSVIILDEAGMVSGQTNPKRGSKRCSSDSGEESRLKTVVLTQVQRQTRKGVSRRGGRTSPRPGERIRKAGCDGRRSRGGNDGRES